MIQNRKTHINTSDVYNRQNLFVVLRVLRPFVLRPPSNVSTCLAIPPNVTIPAYLT